MKLGILLDVKYDEAGYFSVKNQFC